ncbi:hypothetical protein BLNAU_11495 [Blattamonas nauphoetae]|uniref:IP5PC-F beta-propeller domain-containing protein n=1 Tax=Blattamonas nauphoetae TaxID=2049346 RepID=A0ABQ9XPS1_9EUKA|nr:hypothetical protein BLNAU_11495 [Blattamonas nauphoetae]
MQLFKETNWNNFTLTYTIPHNEFRHTFCVNCICADFEREILYTGGRDGTIRSWSLKSNLQDPKCMIVFEGHHSWVTSVVLLSKDTLVSASADKTIRVWDTKNAKCKAILKKHADVVHQLAVPVSGQFICSVGADGNCFQFQIEQTADRRMILMPNPSALASSYSGFGGFISFACDHKGLLWAAGLVGGSVIVGSFEKTQPYRRLSHPDLVKAIIFSEDDQFLLTGCSDGTLYIFDLVQFKLRIEIPFHDPILSMISPYPSTQVIYLGHRSGTIRCVYFDFSTQKLLFIQHQMAMKALQKEEEEGEGSGKRHHKSGQSGSGSSPHRQSSLRESYVSGDSYGYDYGYDYGYGYGYGYGSGSGSDGERSGPDEDESQKSSRSRSESGSTRKSEKKSGSQTGGRSTRNDVSTKSKKTTQRDSSSRGRDDSSDDSSSKEAKSEPTEKSSSEESSDDNKKDTYYSDGEYESRRGKSTGRASSSDDSDDSDESSSKDDSDDDSTAKKTSAKSSEESDSDRDSKTAAQTASSYQTKSGYASSTRSRTATQTASQYGTQSTSRRSSRRRRSHTPSHKSSRHSFSRRASHHRARPPAGPGIHLIRGPSDPASGPPESEVTKDITSFHTPQGAFQMTSESTRAAVAALPPIPKRAMLPPLPAPPRPPIAPRGKQDEPERKEEDKKDDSDNSDLIELDPKPKQESTTRPKEQERPPTGAKPAAPLPTPKAGEKGPEPSPKAAQPTPIKAEPSPPPQLTPQQQMQREVQFQPQSISQQAAEKMRQSERQKSSSSQFSSGGSAQSSGMRSSRGSLSGTFHSSITSSFSDLNSAANRLDDDLMNIWIYPYAHPTFKIHSKPIRKDEYRLKQLKGFVVTPVQRKLFAKNKETSTTSRTPLSSISQSAKPNVWQERLRWNMTSKRSTSSSHAKDSSSGTDTTQLISDEEPNGLPKGQYMDGVISMCVVKRTLENKKPILLLAIARANKNVELWPMMRDPLDGGFTAPAFTIPSSAGLVAFHSLPDQIHVLCQDEDGIVSLWNILTGKLEETLGPGRLEDFAKRFPQPLEFRRKWYTAETKMGHLMITLTVPDCFRCIFATFKKISLTKKRPNTEPQALVDTESMSDDRTVDVMEEEWIEKCQMVNLGEECILNLFESWDGWDMARDLPLHRAKSSDPPIFPPIFPSTTAIICADENNVTLFRTTISGLTHVPVTTFMKETIIIPRSLNPSELCGLTSNTNVGFKSYVETLKEEKRMEKMKAGKKMIMAPDGHTQVSIPIAASEILQTPNTTYVLSDPFSTIQRKRELPNQVVSRSIPALPMQIKSKDITIVGDDPDDVFDPHNLTQKRPESPPLLDHLSAQPLYFDPRALAEPSQYGLKAWVAYWDSLKKSKLRRLATMTSDMMFPVTLPRWVAQVVMRGDLPFTPYQITFQLVHTTQHPLQHQQLLLQSHVREPRMDRGGRASPALTMMSEDSAPLSVLPSIGTYTFTSNEHLLASTIHSFLYNSYLSLTSSIRISTNIGASGKSRHQPAFGQQIIHNRDISLSCNGKLINMWDTLSTIKHMFWRKADPVILHYHHSLI